MNMRGLNGLVHWGQLPNGKFGWIEGMQPAARFRGAPVNPRSGFGAYPVPSRGHPPYLGSFGDDSTVVSVSPSTQTAVVASTSPGGITTTTAPPSTPSTTLQTKIGSHKGALGFLLWARYGLPKPIAAEVMEAAKSMTAAYQQQGGQLGVFGDAPAPRRSFGKYVNPFRGFGMYQTSADEKAALAIDPQALTSDNAPTQDWVVQMSAVISQAVQDYVTDTSDQQAVTSVAATNLSRAATGNTPLATNVSDVPTTDPYGLTSTQELGWSLAVLVGLYLLTKK